MKRVLLVCLVFLLCVVPAHAATTTFVGSLTVPAATGNKATTGVGFQPKAIIFWGNGQTADATNGGTGTSRAPWWGFGVSSSQRAAVTEGDDGSTNPVTSSGVLCIKRSHGATVDFAADFVSMDADGFTVNFTTANATAYVINFMAIGGADVTNAAVISLTSATSTGNQATTGMGFKSDAVFLIGADNGASNNEWALGMGTSSSARGTINGGGGATMGHREQLTTKIYSMGFDASVRCEADLVSLDSDGLTLNWTTASANTHTVYVLGLKGGQYKVGAFLQKTSTGSQAYTGTGFTTKGFYSFNANRTAAQGIDTSGLNYSMVAAASDTTHRGLVIFNSGSFGAESLDRTNVHAAINDDATPTVQARADLTSFDSDGFTFNYATADATARETIYMTIGNAAAASACPHALLLLGAGC